MALNCGESTIAKASSDSGDDTVMIESRSSISSSKFESVTFPSASLSAVMLFPVSVVVPLAGMSKNDELEPVVFAGATVGWVTLELGAVAFAGATVGWLAVELGPGVIAGAAVGSGARVGNAVGILVGETPAVGKLVGAGVASAIPNPSTRSLSADDESAFSGDADDAESDDDAWFSVDSESELFISRTLYAIAPPATRSKNIANPTVK
mmetsp:Transcript_3201/g.7360  ORF Transcript_3201/g.7360 Transcript_3201/m.7360 type:complete len:209 (-) Transcript_3201:611-1237(-)